MNKKELEALVNDMAEASNFGGLDMSGMYGEFALDVAHRAILIEREACAKTCDEIERYYYRDNKCATAIRKRSNVELRGDASRRPS